MNDTIASGAAATESSRCPRRGDAIFRVATVALVTSAVLSGCAHSVNQVVADATASLLEQAAPALDGYWDYELAGVGFPGTILQLEAFWSVTPDNEALSLLLAKAYVAYAQGWIEGEHEIAFAAGEMERSDRLRHRARLVYLRARDLALRSMRNRHKGIDAALKSNSEAELRAYLEKYYQHEGDVGPLFWAGLAWGAAVAVSLDQPELIADLAIAKTLVEHAKLLDDGYFNGGAYLFLGSVESSVPPAMGGDPEKGRAYFEAGLAKTDRKNQMLLVQYARLYAVNTRKRELFTKLLTEVIDAPDLGSPVRLSNKIARHRAERYLAQADQFF